MPKYHEHDCDSCIFLGNYQDKYDLYYCPGRILGGSLIARYGSQGDYTSTAMDIYLSNKENIDKYQPELKAAYQMYNGE